MDKKVLNLWTEYRGYLLKNPYSTSTKSDMFCRGTKSSLPYYDNKLTADHKLLSQIFALGLWDSLYPSRCTQSLSAIVYQTIEEKKQRQYPQLLSMFPCVQWLRDSEWIYNPLFKQSLVTLQSVVNELGQMQMFQKTYQDSDLEGREYQRPIADIDEAGCLSLSEYAYPSTMRLQRIMSGEALVTKQRAKTKRIVGRLLLLDTSSSMLQSIVKEVYDTTDVSRWIYSLAVVIDSLNNLQKYGGVLFITSFSTHLTPYGQITVDDAIQWLADEIKPYGTWLGGDKSKDFFPHATKTLSSMSVDDLELVVVTDGEIPVPSIDLGSTKCHVFGMASDNPKLQALTQQTNGVYVRLDRLST